MKHVMIHAMTIVATAAAQAGNGVQGKSRFGRVNVRIEREGLVTSAFSPPRAP